MKRNSIFILFLLFFSGACFAEESTAVDDFLKDLQEREDSVFQDKLIKNQSEDRFVNTIKLQGLNKITGKTFEIEVKVGEIINFERLKIIPIKCWKSYPEESPENKLLIRIFETNLNDLKEKSIFYGWIFSSSPSISGLEHPLYDIKLEDCYNVMESKK